MNPEIEPHAGIDDERTVDLVDDDLPVLPDQTSDDTDRGWGELGSGGNDDRLLEDRPPHW
ncbi:hypothetical protein J2S43_006433 [Catenuloplanes nepalensis]|uniref:Uncharacterized protein n=1 Tax=Catenuloplanes nepalensis TaxID=587533 RepID=A0ABT9N2M5_9ACTN|nr:hypothetical protein [Catenuloplanes nepalensis]MDP9797921.1 hypothetical protein [Catenuloplanes nepalensis]